MLICFSVQNFMSFKETQSLNMIAGKYSRHKEHLKNANGRNVLAAAGIYGANASGKSNLCEAIDFSRGIAVGNPLRRKITKRYFRLSKEFSEKPGVFEYRLLANEKVYDYGFAIDYRKSRIVSEWLYRHEGKKEVCLFVREDHDSDYSVEGEVKEPFLDNFRGEVSDKLAGETILSQVSYYVKKSSKVLMEMKHVYEWFERVHVITPTSRYVMTNAIASEEGIRKKFEKELIDFDTGILALENGTKKFDVEEWDLTDDFKKKLNKDSEAGKVNVLIGSDAGYLFLEKNEEGEITYKKVLMNHGDPEELFEMEDESDGTKRLFDYIPMLYKRPESCVFVVDELDRCMHTNLVVAFLERFFAYHRNDSSQIVFTTHDTNIMDLDLLRQDEIWFVERDQEHATKLYSLDSYKVRFDKVIDRDYRIGRFGGVPRIPALYQEDLDD